MVDTHDKISEEYESSTELFSMSVDRIADLFENNWHENSIFHIQDILSSLPDTQKDEARLELFLMDISIRFQRGIRLNLREYIESFPQLEAVIRAAYDDLMQSRQLGEYEYYELLGSGGMGNVYRGMHRLLGRSVAIKLLNRKILNCAGGTERFLREIRLAGQLLHPNIVYTENAGQFDDHYYLVMELIEGENIRSFIEKANPLSLPAACEILRQTATGLQYAFENNFVHRDIKPGNLMITRGGIIKIIDFGLGKYAATTQQEEHALTAFGTTLGSIDYVAPEQLVDAASATIQADIYSLGCVFFYLVVGFAPFEQKLMSRDRKMIAHIKGEIPPLSNFLDEIPKEIDAFYQKMVACNLEDRFKTPKEIIDFVTPLSSSDQLQSLLATTSNSFDGRCYTILPPKNLPIATTVTSTTSKEHHFYKRNLILTLLLAIVVSGIFYREMYKTWQSTTTPESNAVTSAVAPVIMPPNVENSPAVTENSTAKIVQHLGYSGEWWFEEIPSLLPIVREYLTTQKNVPENYLVLNQFVLNQIVLNQIVLNQTDSSEATLFENLPSLRPLLEFLAKPEGTTSKNVADFEILTDIFYSDVLEKDTLSASQLHTLAVLFHRLSVLRSEPELEQRALGYYIKAISQYDIEATETAKLLGNLCRFDLARLNYGIHGNADEFQREVDAIQVSNRDSVAFRVHLQAIPALEQMKFGKHQDSILVEAIQTLEKLDNQSLLQKVPHPLLASLHSLFAKALMRQWRLENAERQWQIVEKMAFENSLRNGVNERDAKLSHDVVDAKLAMANLSKYGGDLKMAKYRYRELISAINDAMIASNTEQAESDQSCREQLTAAWEGLGDTTLFLPTHFIKGLLDNSLFSIGEAESAYQQAQSSTTDAAMKFLMQCKLAMLRCNSGEMSESERKTMLDDIREQYWKLSPMDIGFERAREYHRLLNSVLDTSQDSSLLREYLDRYRLNPNPSERYTDERLDLQLFAIRSLLMRKTIGDNRSANDDVKQYLDPILQHLAAERKLRPFLLPFYDLAICSSDADDFIQTAIRISMSRCLRSSEQSTKTQLVFYFPLADVEGFVLFLSPDLRASRRFDLGLTRQQILNAAKNGQTLSLPQELVEYIQLSREKSEILEVSWDDSVCWSAAQEKNRLTPAKWIFVPAIDPIRIK
ncbi:MAG: serine/threonine protein kinase [Thermoguttaceae bacterium]